MTSTTAPAPAPVIFTSEQTQKWELGVSLLLNFWQPLRDAVSCSWGGPDSEDKRDWLCGVIADLWTEDPEADDETVEERLIQVMEDEFDVNLEDDSAYEVGKQVLALRNEIIENNYATVDALQQRFLARPCNASAPRIQEVNQDADSGDEADFDEEMGDTPASAPSQPRERQERVVDDDGFELVQKPRRR